MKKLFVILPLFTLSLKAHQSNDDLFNQAVKDLNKCCQSFDRLFSALHSLGSTDFPIEIEHKSPAKAIISKDDANVIITLKGIIDKQEVKSFYNEFEKNLTLIIKCADDNLQARITKDMLEIEHRADRKEEIKGENGQMQKITTNAFHSCSSQSLPEPVDIGHYHVEENEQEIAITIPKVRYKKNK